VIAKLDEQFLYCWSNVWNVFCFSMLRISGLVSSFANVLPSRAVVLDLAKLSAIQLPWMLQWLGIQ
jgi:hypothetical protein